MGLDYYFVLGVARDASTEEIERAFKALARKVHPDLNSADGRADERMKQLNEIRETLTDPLLRSAYDDRLRAESPERPPEAQRRDGDPEEGPAAPSVAFQAAPVHPAFLRWRHAFPDARRALALLLAAAACGAIVFFVWRPAPTPTARLITPSEPPAERHPRRDAVTIVRREAGAKRQAIRKTAGVVRLGSSFDDVIRRFGPPDRAEQGAGSGDVTLIYGKLRLELRDGKVVGGSP